ncbi:hypothetical protein JVT61DRAFT_6506 [Boletus reticuloceps]|uniref:Uncharacterized protein n=1 Tax=Boletus reticuloceps TaxID=495285 RepID=A0A8I2YJ95_9AGAM|nr:hypothetical protein JVT61DRAFT_6506 [Boletus reticuloceps]
MDNPTSAHTTDPVLPDASISALKRRIAALEEENVQLTSKISRSPIHSWTREGRAIRRLVNLIDPVTDLIVEYDQRLELAGGNENLELVESTAEQNRAFRSFKKLIIWCPSLKRTMQVPIELTLACNQLKRGADGARGDDANILKFSVATWLNEQQPPPCPLLLADDKRGRGFNHDLTGSLLCPVDFNWLDAPTRYAIRDYHPNYAITAHMWPRGNTC